MKRSTAYPWVIYAIVFATFPSATGAQEPEPGGTARIRLGPVALTPAIAVTDLGVDSNVFNETSDPKSDFTFTTAPQLNASMRTQRGLLTADARLSFVYFKGYKSEQSVNGRSDLMYEYRFNRIRPFASFSLLDTRERPGYEIDARARRFEKTLRIGINSRLGGKGNVQLDVRRRSLAFAGDALFLTRRLQDILNRNLWAVGSSWRQQITPLTTLVLAASHEQERFEFSPYRDSNSLRLDGGFELARFALIRGVAVIGVQRLRPMAGSFLREFSGFTSNVNVSYTAPTRSRLTLSVLRDLQYSFEDENPYYVQTGWTVGVTQRVVGRWDVSLIGGQNHLAYRSNTGGLRNVPSDRVDRVGGGLGYEVRPGTSIGFIVDSFYRNSTRPARRYQTIRSFATINYGF